MGKSRGCIIRKNTKELRESLMSLRYRWLVKEKGANCIVTNPEILKYMELQEKSARAWKDKGWIDCGTNNDMFLAIAALANNTDLGQWLIVNRWKRESEELIAELEKLCGKKWVNPYMPEKERFTLTLTDEERSLVEECIKAGYYSTENIEKRREEAHKAKMMKKRAEICERYDKRIRQAEAEKKIMLCVFDYGLSTDNAIYYPHSNTLSFNWNNCENKITQKEFDNFVNNVNRSQLLKGIKFELK